MGTDTGQQSGSSSRQPLENTFKTVLLLGVVFLLALFFFSIHPHNILKTVEDSIGQMPEGDFRFQTLDGQTARLEDYRGKVVLLNYWATWCEPCIEELPALISLQRKFESRGFTVLGISIDEFPKKTVPALAREFGINFPVLVEMELKDQENEILSEWLGVFGIPYNALMDKSGAIRWQESGARNWNDPKIHQAIEWLLK